jgi:hypothetical protein
LTRRVVVSIDTLVVDGVKLDPKAFEASLARELGARLAGRAAPTRGQSSSDAVARKVASTVHRELSR